VKVNFASGETGASISAWTSPALPPFSSRQFSIQELEAAAKPAIVSIDKVRYTLEISANFPGFFQHVLWNQIGASLTNISGCGNGVSNDVLHLNNVHSSLISDYPSVILAHNIGAKAADALIGVYDSNTGTRIGGVIIPDVPPNASAEFRMNEVEAALSFVPIVVEGPYHYNLVQEGDFPGYLQHVVQNTLAGVITNMTAKCAFPIRG